MNVCPKIRVIMPIFNGEQYVSHAVKSIFAQPYKNIDIIIVDDGSTDNSPMICDELARVHKNIVVIHTANGGVSSARNTAIEYIINNFDSENSYVAFCDADDLWANNCLTEDIENGFDTDIVCFQSCSMSNDTKMCSPPHGKGTGSDVLPGGCKSIFKYPYHFGAFLYKTKLFKYYNIRFDTNLKYNEDKVLLMQLLYLAENIREIPRMLYLYRKNLSSAMHIRPHGIEYYIPLINGWMRSDDAMKAFANDHRGELVGGYALAMIYVIDMAKEHYWYFKNKRVLEDVIFNHNVYPHFLSLKACDVSENQYREYMLFKKHPAIFKIKYNAIGCVVRLLKSIRKIGFVANFLYKREFIYENKYI